MSSSNFEKIVVVTRRTRLDELKARFHSVTQARFYLEHAGVDFAPYIEEDLHYKDSLHLLQKSCGSLPDLKLQIIDRLQVPNFSFGNRDVVVVLGQDGTVANTAKYASGIPLIGVNPDPKRIDGVLLPFVAQELPRVLSAVLAASENRKLVTLGELSTTDGQRLLAFNDFFIGCKGHASFRYKIQQDEQRENHSSSGIIVSTGAGSTGWMSSIFNAGQAFSRFVGVNSVQNPKLSWESEKLMFAVREPFASKSTQIGMILGWVDRKKPLVIESAMPQDGVIFSDGIENDYLQFNSGSVATVSVSEKKAHLVLR